jgi:hypothetical protein
MQFQELITFVNKYRGEPSDADLNHFFKKDILAIPVDGDAIDWEKASGSLVKSGDAAIATDIAEKLISKKGYAIFHYDGNDAELLWLAGETGFVRINNLKSFGELISTQNPLILIKGLNDGLEEIFDKDTAELMVDEDLSNFDKDSTWIDEDDDFGYTDWSRLFNSWGYQKEGQLAWLIQIDDFEFALMNWPQTAVNVLLAYINTKV